MPFTQERADEWIIFWWDRERVEGRGGKRGRGDLIIFCTVEFQYCTWDSERIYHYWLSFDETNKRGRGGWGRRGGHSIIFCTVEFQYCTWDGESLYMIENYFLFVVENPMEVMKFVFWFLWWSICIILIQKYSMNKFLHVQVFLTQDNVFKHWGNDTYKRRKKFRWLENSVCLMVDWDSRPT